MQTALSLSVGAEPARVVPATHHSNSAESRLGSASQLESRQRTAASPSIRVRFDSGANRAAGKVKPAILGNHIAIQRFLQRQLQEPTPLDFAAIVNHPGYEAAQRLIIQEGAQRELLGHVHVQPATMRFGSTEMPIAKLRHFAVYPEYCLQGYDAGLLVAAEKEAKRQGAMVCVARGENRELLNRHGWAPFGFDPVSIVSPRRLLGQIPPPAKPESPFYANPLPTSFVRIGRLTDLDAMARLYRDHVSSHYGTAVRDSEYWSWLVTRGAHHRIYMFFENDVARAYVVVRHATILEIVDSTDNGRGAARLLEQVGADAIEQGRYSLRIYAPINDLVHHWADQAAGRLHVGSPGESWMVKVTSYRALLRRLAPEMFRRQRKQDIVDAFSVRIGSEEIRIARGVRSMKVTRGTAQRHRVGLTQKAATQLLLGYRSADQLADTQQLVASTDQAMRTIRVLFPALNLWRAEWDEAPSLR